MGEQKLSDIPGLHKKQVRVPQNAVNGTDEEFVLFEAEEAIEVVEVNTIYDAAVTGADDNNFTSEVVNKKADASGTTVVATGAEMAAGVNYAAFIKNALTVSTTAANRLLAKGHVLVYKSNQKGTGLADTEKSVEVLYKYRTYNE